MRYLLLNTVQFEVLPLQLGGGEKSPPPDDVAMKLFGSDPAQTSGQKQTTPAYHKLQLRPSKTVTDGVGWPVLRSMQIAWEVTARWYKEVIVDEGWNAMGRTAHGVMIAMHSDGDAMGIDGEENNDFKNDKHVDDINNPAINTGLGDFVAAELRRNVTKTKFGRDEPSGSTDIDLEIGRWVNHIENELN